MNEHTRFTHRRRTSPNTRYSCPRTNDTQPESTYFYRHRKCRNCLSFLASQFPDRIQQAAKMKMLFTANRIGNSFNPYTVPGTDRLYTFPSFRIDIEYRLVLWSPVTRCYCFDRRSRARKAPPDGSKLSIFFSLRRTRCKRNIGFRENQCYRSKPVTRNRVACTRVLIIY